MGGSLTSLIDDSEYLKHARVFFLADYFLVDGLKELAAQRFRGTLQKCTGAMLAECVTEIYQEAGADDLLRRMVVNQVKACLSQVWGSEELKRVVRENGDFAVDIVDTLVPRIPHAPQFPRKFL